ncbi:hypothetical protein [Bradyrhizobium sp.]|uniref:hypothetical protein n=1 Tax=Bradyrhizobium sp. TaxID=376 RepID=UPI003BAE590A
MSPSNHLKINTKLVFGSTKRHQGAGLIHGYFGVGEASEAARLEAQRRRFQGHSRTRCVEAVPSPCRAWKFRIVLELDPANVPGGSNQTVNLA